MVRLAHHPELIEGEGLAEIFGRCLLNDGLISNKHEGWFWGTEYIARYRTKIVDSRTGLKGDEK